ncbi:hypothetical protein HID58_092797 [Brassica napus]|uniref:Uncharacterized protein n=1 Tax=Brassica napus TaxID=3708 RepID=A0ABQ7XD83_BRANA|nr:hypothetical protein HID58_092797 [Brassica napus]
MSQGISGNARPTIFNCELSVTNAVRLFERSTPLTLPRPTHIGWLCPTWKNRLPSRGFPLDQASVAVECLPSFRRLWGVGVHNPIPPFLEDLCVVRNLLRGGPLLWGYFSPERVRAAVETHRSCFSSSIDDDMGVFFEDTSLPAVYATGQSSGQRPPDAEDDAEPTVEDPVFGG